MRKVFTLIAALMMMVSINTSAKKWELACQAWTFNRFTLSETLDEMEKLRLKYIELYPKQKFAADDDRTTHFSMPDAQIEELKLMLKQHKIKVGSYGVISPTKEKDWKQLFEFAKKMGIKTIVSEPKQELLPMIDALCVEYKIQVAIHNHPNPTRYWNPDIVLKALEGRSEYMGVCADVGHWTRSGLNVAECLKQLDGRVFEIHTKDVNRTDKEGHAVVWGEGVIDWKSVTAELQHQKFKGKWVIEHEHNWENPVPDLQKNISFFNTSILK